VGLCSASLQAIGMGMQAIHSGQLDAVIVGGISGKVNPINLARLELMDVISTDLNLDPTKRSRPFDQKRSGFVLAEGAVLFVIEKRNNILQRGDKPLLNLLGYGASLGAEHIVAPHQNSLEMRLAMQRALDSARMSALEVDLINVHGTSTVLNDLHESQAINSVFGNDEVSVTANKSLHGHLIAAAGAMEVLNTLISTQEGFIPGSINCDHQDRQCKINLIKNTINETPNFILKNSFGMGGLAASMLLGRGDL
jgi:3-oxoacyl-[acyl-carrier-protein] synthase II